MIKVARMLGAMLLLAGCDKPKVDVRNASVGEVAEAAQKSGVAAHFKPGRWESKLRMLEMKAPGMPAEAVSAMGAMAGKERVYATCLSAADAARPAGDFFAGDSKDCTYEKFVMGNGTIDARMTCGGGRAVMAMNGTYTPESYAMTMQTTADSGPAGAMTMRMAIDAKHSGACRGDEDGRG